MEVKEKYRWKILDGLLLSNVDLIKALDGGCADFIAVRRARILNKDLGNPLQEGKED